MLSGYGKVLIQVPMAFRINLHYPFGQLTVCADGSAKNLYTCKNSCKRESCIEEPRKDSLSLDQPTTCQSQPVIAQLHLPVAVKKLNQAKVTDGPARHMGRLSDAFAALSNSEKAGRGSSGRSFVSSSSIRQASPSNCARWGTKFQRACLSPN